jgi:xanthine dehydrogenase YagT iron-sulfur-binding subunit
MSDQQNHDGLSRRGFIKGVGGGIVGAASLSTVRPAGAAEKYGRVVGPEKATVLFTVNGEKKKLNIDPRITLLDAMRDQLDFTGTKRVCNRGECGACTMIMNGDTILACSMLALDADGADIQTIEGLAKGDVLHPVQQKFVDNDALQCGFCTPGFIMSGVALLANNSTPTMDDIKYSVSGNLCRCGTYPHVFKAINDAAKDIKKGG